MIIGWLRQICRILLAIISGWFISTWHFQNLRYVSHIVGKSIKKEILLQILRKCQCIFMHLKFLYGDNLWQPIEESKLQLGFLPKRIVLNPYILCIHMQFVIYWRLSYHRSLVADEHKGRWQIHDLHCERTTDWYTIIVNYAAVI